MDFCAYLADTLLRDKALSCDSRRRFP